MAQIYEVCTYSFNELVRLMTERTRAEPFVVNNKSHVVYLYNYLTQISARTIVAEFEYIDHDYLDDFAQYYVRCFYPYDKVCTRLHFFSHSFDDGQFYDLLAGKAEDFEPGTIADCYLGFIVLKPLNQTIIGRTCLKTYPTNSKPREFPITRRYEAQLFGIPLVVNTIAFQEQDQVAGACATSALWSAFQGTGKLFQHAIPSPVEITKSASSHISLESRILPSQGLTLDQMADAIRGLSLEPFVVRANNEYVLKSTVYAYLRGQVPVIIKLFLFDPDSGETKEGSHAVVVTGYSLGANVSPRPNTGFLLRATRIDKFYVHDDQIGPFSRVVFTNTSVYITDQDVEKEYTSLLTHWYKHGKLEALGYAPENLLIPLYNKIRIPFGRIRNIVHIFDQYIELIRSACPVLDDRIEWDIYLITVNKLKEDVYDNEMLEGDYKVGILTESMPRFMWRASAYSVQKLSFDLLFDATDIEQGKLFVRTIEYDQYTAKVLRMAFRAFDETALRTSPAWAILDWFRRND